jgi:hypothetical protein
VQRIDLYHDLMDIVSRHFHSDLHWRASEKGRDRERKDYREKIGELKDYLWLDMLDEDIKRLSTQSQLSL